MYATCKPSAIFEREKIVDLNCLLYAHCLFVLNSLCVWFGVFSPDSSPASNQSVLNGSKSSLVTQLSPLSTHFGSSYTETSAESSGSTSGSSTAEPPYLTSSLSCQNESGPVTPNFQTQAFRKRRKTNDLLLHGHELVCIDTYVGRKVDELTVNKGDWIYADMKLKDGRGWIWAYSPANKSQGFVPRSCVRPPATTPL